MQKLKRSEVSLEGSGKLTSSCLDYPIFLLNPQLLNLIRRNFKASFSLHPFLGWYNWKSYLQ
jgi:hypothetical protein